MRWWVTKVMVREPNVSMGARILKEMTFDAEDYAWIDEVGLHFTSCEGEKTHIPMHRIEEWKTTDD